MVARVVVVLALVIAVFDLVVVVAGLAPFVTAPLVVPARVTGVVAEPARVVARVTGPLAARVLEAALAAVAARVTGPARGGADSTSCIDPCAVTRGTVLSFSAISQVRVQIKTTAHTV